MVLGHDGGTEVSAGFDGVCWTCRHKRDVRLAEPDGGSGAKRITRNQEAETSDVCTERSLYRRHRNESSIDVRLMEN